MYLLFVFSIAVEPLHPQVCQKGDKFKMVTMEGQISPIELSRALNSVACSLSVKREDPISIYDYVMNARHYTSCLWNSGKNFFLLNLFSFIIYLWILIFIQNFHFNSSILVVLLRHYDVHPNPRRNTHATTNNDDRASHVDLLRHRALAQRFLDGYTDRPWYYEAAPRKKPNCLQHGGVCFRGVVLRN